MTSDSQTNRLQYATVVPHLHREHAGILFSFSSEAPPPAATVPSSSRADEPAAVAMESTPGGTTTTTILRRKVSSDMKFFLLDAVLQLEH